MKVSMSFCVGAVAVAALASSCGSKGSTAGDGGDGAAVQCPPPGGGEAEPQPETFLVNGGVPLIQYARALAVARCNFLSRCFGLATYAANNCIETMVSLGNWTFITCKGDFAEAPICGGYDGNYNTGARADLLNAAISGTVHYSEERAGNCISALLNQACVNNSVVEDIPACAGVFTCSADADASVSDGGAPADGGVCAEANLLDTPVFRACSTDDECAGETRPGGPHCTGGICSPSVCGLGVVASCQGYVQAGDPCDIGADSYVSPSVYVSPSGTMPRVCAPGLACQFAADDAGMGTCVVPQDVGGPCTLSSNCKPALVCTCGTCTIPPSSGPCVDNRCKFGVAYCDQSVNLCKPMVQQGDHCSGDILACSPGLTCVFGDDTCQLSQP